MEEKLPNMHGNNDSQENHEKIIQGRRYDRFCFIAPRMSRPMKIRCKIVNTGSMNVVILFNALLIYKTMARIEMVNVMFAISLTWLCNEK